MQHHAILIRTTELAQYVQPDTTAAVYYERFDRLGINDVRSIQSKSQLRPETDHGHVFVIVCSSITHEAQNALLKLLEEPPTDTRFVLVVPPAVQLLPTVLSRLGSEEYLVTTDSVHWAEFVAAGYTQRIKQIEVWHKTKDADWLNGITAGVHTYHTDSLPLTTKKILRLVGSKLQTRGASNKMLLEHLALALPLQK